MYYESLYEAMLRPRCDHVDYITEAVCGGVPVAVVSSVLMPKMVVGFAVACSQHLDKGQLVPLSRLVDAQYGVRKAQE